MRLALVVIAVRTRFSGDTMAVRWGVVCLLAASSLLDLLDGELARKYGQASRFGAIFDQAIDLITHTVVWWLSGFFLAVPLLLLEWCAGIAVSRAAITGSVHWKSVLTERRPTFVRRYFANRQRNWLSAIACVSHFAFPMSLYADFGGWQFAGLWFPGLVLYEAVTAMMLFALRNAMRIAQTARD